MSFGSSTQATRSAEDRGSSQGVTTPGPTRRNAIETITGSNEMTLVGTATPVTGEEHWTDKGAASSSRCRRSAPATGRRRPARSCSSTALRWQLGRCSISRCPAVRNPPAWIFSPAAASTAGASTWRDTAARLRTATTTRRFRRAPTIASPPRNISSRCAATSPCLCTAYRRAHFALACLHNGIPNSWRGSRSMPRSGPEKAVRRLPIAASSCPSSAQEPSSDPPCLCPLHLYT